MYNVNNYNYSHYTCFEIKGALVNSVHTLHHGVYL